MPFFKYSHVPLSVLMSTLLLSACISNDKPNRDLASTSTENEHAQNSVTDIESLKQNMIELGSIPKTPALKGNDELVEPTERNNNAIAQQSTSKYQQFLVQQAHIKNNLPAQVVTQYQFALTHMKNKEWQGAIKQLKRIIELSPNLSAAYLNIALAHYHLQQTNEAILWLNKAEAVNPINPYLYNLQGILAREKGNFVQAEQYYQQALAIWPNYPQAHLNAAVLFELYRGKFIQAKTHYQAYLALKPNDKQTQKWLAGLEIKLASRKDS